MAILSLFFDEIVKILDFVPPVTKKICVSLDIGAKGMVIIFDPEEKAVSRSMTHKKKNSMKNKRLSGSMSHRIDLRVIPQASRGPNARTL